MNIERTDNSFDKIAVKRDKGSLIDLKERESSINNITKLEKKDNLIDKYSYFLSIEFNESIKYASNIVFDDFNNWDLSLDLLKLLSSKNYDSMIWEVYNEIQFFEELSNDDEEISKILQSEVAIKIQSWIDTWKFFLEEAIKDKKTELVNLTNNKKDFYKFLLENRYM